MDDLKSAGLLRKGQVIGGLVDAVDDDKMIGDDIDDDDDPDLLEEALMEAGLDAAVDEEEDA